MFGVNVCQRLVLRRCHAGMASENVLEIWGTLSSGRDPHRRHRWPSWFSGAKKPDRREELAWYADLLSLCLDSQVPSKVVNSVEMEWSSPVRTRAAGLGHLEPTRKGQRARGEREAQRQRATSWAHSEQLGGTSLHTSGYFTSTYHPNLCHSHLQHWPQEQSQPCPPAHASYEDMIMFSYLATRTVT